MLIVHEVLRKRHLCIMDIPQSNTYYWISNLPIAHISHSFPYVGIIMVFHALTNSILLPLNLEPCQNRERKYKRASHVDVRKHIPNNYDRKESMRTNLDPPHMRSRFQKDFRIDGRCFSCPSLVMNSWFGIRLQKPYTIQTGSLSLQPLEMSLAVES